MKKDVQLMRLSAVSLAVSSFSLLFVSVSDYNGNFFNQMMAILVGITFWSFLIAGYVLFLTISKHRKAYEKVQIKTNPSARKRRIENKKRRIGAFCIFSNTCAVISDVSTIVSFVLALVFMFVPGISRFVQTFMIALLIYSIQMHCILNGVNFKYIQEISKKCKQKGE